MGGLPPEPLPPESPVQQIVLTPTGDGGVAIDLGLPESQVIPDGGEELGDLLLEQPGPSIVARDGNDSVEYDVRADSVRFATLGMPGYDDGQVVAGECRACSCARPSTSVPTAPPPSASARTASPMSRACATLPGHDQQHGGAGRDLAFAVGVLHAARRRDARHPREPRVRDAMRQGLALSLELSSEGGTQTSSYEGFPLGYRTETTNQPGTGSLSIDVTGMRAAGGFGGGSAVVSSEELPFGSMELSYGPMEAEFTLPFGTVPQEARYFVSVRDLALGEAAWAQIDPQGLVPHDPLTLVLDVGGRVALDLPAMAAAEAAGQVAPPPVVESIEVRNVEVAGLGLRASATGSFTFDPLMTEPQPGSSMTVRLDGVDRLIDALVTLGWITQDDAFNTRIGLAAVFRAVGADQRESVIAVGPDGTITANGMPLQ
jgi:hypothetical protein